MLTGSQKRQAPEGKLYNFQIKQAGAAWYSLIQLGSQALEGQTDERMKKHTDNLLSSIGWPSLIQLQTNPTTVN